MSDGDLYVLKWVFGTTLVMGIVYVGLYILLDREDR